MILMQPPSLLIGHLNGQLRRGYAPIVLFVGRQRSGKTAAALTYAYEFDKDFDVDKQMIFNIADFIEAVWKFNKKVIILDEVGTYLDPTMHLQLQQRAYAHIIQSQAYKQNIIFLVTPHAHDFGKYHRKDVDSIVRIVGRNKNGAIAKISAVYTDYADLNEIKMWRKEMEIVSNIPLPPKHIWDAYINKYQSQQKEEILERERLKVMVKEMRDAMSQDRLLNPRTAQPKKLETPCQRLI